MKMLTVLCLAGSIISAWASSCSSAPSCKNDKRANELLVGYKICLAKAYVSKQGCKPDNIFPGFYLTSADRSCCEEQEAKLFQCVQDGKATYACMKEDVQEDLIDYVDPVVSYAEGEDISVEVFKIEPQKIQEISWVCNGVDISSSSRYSVTNPTNMNILTIRDGSGSDAGSCTCTAKSGTSEESVTIQLVMGDKYIITPKKRRMRCKTHKMHRCKVRFSVESRDGNAPSGSSVQICRLVGTERVNCLVNPTLNKNGYYKATLPLPGMEETDSVTGEYVCVVEEGQTFVSSPQKVKVIY